MPDAQELDNSVTAVTEPVTENTAEKKDGILTKISNAGKGFFEKWGGKGLMGAGAGLLLSTAVFKSKSPVMMLAMTGCGFVAEKLFVKRPEEASYVNDKFPYIEVKPDTAGISPADLQEVNTAVINEPTLEYSGEELQNMAAVMLGSVQTGTPATTPVTNRYQTPDTTLTVNTGDTSSESSLDALPDL